MSIIAENLCKARDLIKDPAHWTTGSCARDARGEEVASTSQSAVCWCALGALFHFDSCGAELHLLEKVADELTAGRACDWPNTSIPFVNDNLGHAHVIEMYERAIRIAEESYP